MNACSRGGGGAGAQAPRANPADDYGLRSPLDDLDARAPRIGDVGDRRAGRRILAGRLVKLYSFALDLLDECGVVLHVEPEVIEHAALGRKLRLVVLGKADLNARDIHDRGVVARVCLAAKGLRIPSLRLGNIGFQQAEMHMLVLDW